MNDYIKRADAQEIAIRTCGDYAAAWAEIRKLPAANVVEGDEYDSVRQALAWMWYAYANKDGECPHDFEARAVEMAEEVLGKWEDCMPQLLRDEGKVAQRGKWIKTEDEQPEKSGLYLGVAESLPKVRTYEYVKSKDEWLDTHFFDQWDVIYWMPLPALPKRLPND